MVGTGAAVDQILIVAALKRELAAVRQGKAQNVALLETGEGAQNCEAALRRYINERAPRAVLGIGFAGALSESLEVGDLVIVDGFCGSDVRPPETLIRVADKVDMGGVRHGVAVTVDEVVSQSRAKAELARSLQDDEIGIVDMESSIVATICAETRVPFAVVRAVSDLFSEDLPIDFNRYRTRDGRVSELRVMMAAVVKPSSIKGLRELDRRAKYCAGRLAAFVGRFVTILEG